MNLYKYYEQKNTGDKPAAVSRAYKVIDRICKAVIIDKDFKDTKAASDFSKTELAEALVILHLVAESRKNEYLKAKEELSKLREAMEDNP